MRKTVWIELLTLFVATASCFADKKVKLEAYATKDVLTEGALVDYIIDYNDIPYSKLKAGARGAPTAATKKANPLVSDTLALFQLKYGKRSNYTIAEVGAVMKQPKPPGSQFNELPAWQKITPLTTPYKVEKETFAKEDGTRIPREYRGSEEDIRLQRKSAGEDPQLKDTASVSPRSWASAGPLRIRNSVDSVFNYAIEDQLIANFMKVESGIPDKNFLSAKGARVSYSNDRLKSDGSKWSTEGALIFPFHTYSEPTKTSSWFFHAALAGAWKVESAQGADNLDVSELKFSAPVVAGWPGIGFFQLNPYFQTDTDFKGEIYGATASFDIFANPCFGVYHKIAEVGGREVDVRIRLAALVDYSEVGRESPYSTRKKGDDWWRAGGEAGLEFGFFDITDRKRPAITAGASYRFLESIDAKGEGGHLLKANISWWLSQFAAITISYEEGQTPVAAKNIDLLKVGFELRY